MFNLSGCRVSGIRGMRWKLNFSLQQCGIYKLPRTGVSSNTVVFCLHSAILNKEKSIETEAEVSDYIEDLLGKFVFSQRCRQVAFPLYGVSLFKVYVGSILFTVRRGHFSPHHTYESTKLYQYTLASGSLLKCL